MRTVCRTCVLWRPQPRYVWRRFTPIFTVDLAGWSQLLDLTDDRRFTKTLPRFFDLHYYSVKMGRFCNSKLFLKRPKTTQNESGLSGIVWELFRREICFHLSTPEQD